MTQESLREYTMYEMQVTKHMYNMISILLKKKLKDEKNLWEIHQDSYCLFLDGGTLYNPSFLPPFFQYFLLQHMCIICSIRKQKNILFKLKKKCRDQGSALSTPGPTGPLVFFTRCLDVTLTD